MTKKLEDYNFFDEEVLECPFEFYKLARSEAPVYQLPGTNIFLVTRHADIRAMLKDTETFSSNFAHLLTGPEESEEIKALYANVIEPADTLLTLDPPRHRVYRSLVNKVFSAKRVEQMHDYIAQIVDDLAEMFAPDLAVSSLSDGVYLVRIADFEPPAPLPHPLSILGRPVGGWVEQSRQVLPWYRLFNEIQMYLHQHPLNQERQAQGKLPINSLWAWGSGSLPKASSEMVCFCDDPLLAKFTAALGCDTRSLDRLKSDSVVEAAMVLDLRLLRSLKSGDPVRLDALLGDIEAEVIALALRLADQQSLPLRLFTGGQQDLVMGPRAGWRFWRQPRTLRDFTG